MSDVPDLSLVDMVTLREASRRSGHSQSYWRAQMRRYPASFPMPVAKFAGRDLWSYSELIRWDAKRRATPVGKRGMMRR